MKHTRTNYLQYFIGLLAVFLSVALDQYSKSLAVQHLKEQDPIVLIDGVFQLHYLENRGAAFGILQNQKWFFVISGILILAAVAYCFHRFVQLGRYVPLRICGIALAAGAIGNMIDRVSLGYVVDFFYFNLIDFPIFNVADIYVTLTAFALILLLLFYYKEADIEEMWAALFPRRKNGES